MFFAGKIAIELYLCISDTFVHLLALTFFHDLWIEVLWQYCPAKDNTASNSYFYCMLNSTLVVLISEPPQGEDLIECVTKYTLITELESIRSQRSFEKVLKIYQYWKGLLSPVNIQWISQLNPSCRLEAIFFKNQFIRTFKKLQFSAVRWADKPLTSKL